MILIETSLALKMHKSLVVLIKKGHNWGICADMVIGLQRMLIILYSNALTVFKNTSS